jgi:hypothetical protein
VTGTADVEFSDLELHVDHARRKSGLAVVVFEDYDEIIRPSHELGRKLLNLGLAAAAIALAVAIGMWLVAARMLRQTGRRLARGETGGDDGARGTANAESSGAAFTDATGRRIKTEAASEAAQGELTGTALLHPTEVFERREEQP